MSKRSQIKQDDLITMLEFKEYFNKDKEINVCKLLITTLAN
jgi:hypothetical protein